MAENITTLYLITCSRDGEIKTKKLPARRFFLETQLPFVGSEPYGEWAYKILDENHFAAIVKEQMLGRAVELPRVVLDTLSPFDENDYAYCHSKSPDLSLFIKQILGLQQREIDKHKAIIEQAEALCEALRGMANE